MASSLLDYSDVAGCDQVGVSSPLPHWQDCVFPLQVLTLYQERLLLLDSFTAFCAVVGE